MPAGTDQQETANKSVQHIDEIVEPKAVPENLAETLKTANSPEDDYEPKLDLKPAVCRPLKCIWVFFDPKPGNKEWNRGENMIDMEP